MVCGRGAPHCIHTPASFWRALRFGSDGDVLALLNRVIGVPLETDESQIPLKAALWRSAIVPSMVHCGDEPKAGTEEAMPPFPLPIGTADAGAANQYATGAPKVSACPVIAIGSNRDRIWPWGMPARWADVAAAGFRAEEIEAVMHFKLMSSTDVVELVQRELAGAALALARFG